MALLSQPFSFVVPDSSLRILLMCLGLEGDAQDLSAAAVPSSFFLINISYFFDKMQGLKMYGNFISTAHP